MLALAAHPGAAAVFPRVPLPWFVPHPEDALTSECSHSSSAARCREGFGGGCVTLASNYAGNVGFVGFYD